MAYLSDALIIEELESQFAPHVDIVSYQVHEARPDPRSAFYLLAADIEQALEQEELEEQAAAWENEALLDALGARLLADSGLLPFDVYQQQRLGHRYNPRYDHGYTYAYSASYPLAGPSSYYAAPSVPRLEEPTVSVEEGDDEADLDWLGAELLAGGKGAQVWIIDATSLARPGAGPSSTVAKAVPSQPTHAMMFADFGPAELPHYVDEYEPDIVDPGSTIPPSPGMSLYPMQGISQSLPVQPEPERPLASSPFIPTKASTSTNPGSGSGSAQSVAQPTPGTDAPPPRHVQPKATSVMDEDAEAALEVEPAPGFGSGAGLGAGVAPLGDEDGLPPRKTAKVTDSCTAQV